MDSTAVLDAIDTSMEALKAARELLTETPAPLMTVEDIAAYWRCSSQHVRNVLATSYFNGKIRRIGGAIRVRREDVLSFGVDEEA